MIVLLKNAAIDFFHSCYEKSNKAVCQHIKNFIYIYIYIYISKKIRRSVKVQELLANRFHLAEFSKPPYLFIRQFLFILGL